MLSSSVSPFKTSYSSDEIDRLLQMTPEKSRWNNLKNKATIVGDMRKFGKRSLKESSFSCFHGAWNEKHGVRNEDDEFWKGDEMFGKEETKSMNNKEQRLDVDGIPRSGKKRTCSLCLEERCAVEFHTIWSCGCSFCRSCLSQYLTTCIRENMNVPFLSCPSADCPQIQHKSVVKSQSTSAMKQVLSRTFTFFTQYPLNGVSNGGGRGVEGMIENQFSRPEIEMLVDEKCFDLFLKLKTEYEVEIDPHRTFCPSVDCENICIISKSMIVSTDPVHQIKSTKSSIMISSTSVSSTLSSLAAASSSAVSSVIKKSSTGIAAGFVTKESDAILVRCNKCDRTFCCRCRAQPFHFGSPCSRPSPDQSDLLHPSLDGPEIKRCPKCSIWIEREDGCAQMMCRKCRHVFCWFCLQSLEV